MLPTISTQQLPLSLWVFYEYVSNVSAISVFMRIKHLHVYSLIYIRTKGNVGAVIVLIFVHILVLREYWILTESRIPLKLGLGSVRIVGLSISPHEQTQ